MDHNTLSPGQNKGIIAVGSAPEASRYRLSSHRSDHEIHTPEHRSFANSASANDDQTPSVVQGLVTPHRYPSIHRSVSPRFIRKLPSDGAPSPSTQDSLLNDEDDENIAENSSGSYSSTSYVSAVGSQEDFTLVDLHMQVNRLIIDSPMLMSSYVSHLSQVRD